MMSNRSVLGVAVLSFAALGELSWAIAQPVKGKPLPPRMDRPGPVPDFRPLAAAIDREIDRGLARAGAAASPPAEDADFLRRAHLDIVGRVPTAKRTAAFLDSTDPNKRERLIDELLASPDFGRHQADLWRPVVAPRDPANTKVGVDRFSPWLGEQFNANRGWDHVAADLIGATGPVIETPATAFVLANGESLRPRANMLTAAAGRVFLGVRLDSRSATTTRSPAGPRTTSGASRPISAAPATGRPRAGRWPSPTGRARPTRRPAGPSRPEVRPGGAIVVPATGGNQGAGKVVRPHVLGGEPEALPDDGPARPRFVAWATARDNPYFARAFVNRTSAQFLGRGLVNPVDDAHDGNPASHPELLKELAERFATSDFDIKHLIRGICNSRAYQRSGRPAAGNDRAAQNCSPACWSNRSRPSRCTTPSRSSSPSARPGRGPASPGRSPRCRPWSR